MMRTPSPWSADNYKSRKQLRGKLRLKQLTQDNRNLLL